MYPSEEAQDSPLIAKAIAADKAANGPRRPLGGATTVAREKVAIEEVISLTSLHLGALEDATVVLGSRLGVVSTAAPMDSGDGLGFEYMGSSPVYDQLHSQLARVAQLTDVVNTLTRRLEV